MSVIELQDLLLSLIFAALATNKVILGLLLSLLLSRNFIRKVRSCQVVIQAAAGENLS